MNTCKPVTHYKIQCEIFLEDYVLDPPVVWIYIKGLPTNQDTKSERDVLRFHWVKNCNPSVIEVNRFSRLAFGLIQSLFILKVL